MKIDTRRKLNSPMNFTTEDLDLEIELNPLSKNAPSGVLVLPENFNSVLDPEEYIFPDSLSDLKKVFKENEVILHPLGKQPFKYRGRKYADWFGPTFFFSLTLLTENPTIVSVSLNVLSNYLTDFFKGTVGEKRARFEIYIEKKGKKKVKRIIYNGPPEGIRDLEGMINKFIDE